MKKFMSFINDDDGFSAKDFLMVLFGVLFASFLVTAFIISIMGDLKQTTIHVIQLLDGVIITIVGGVFGIQGIKEFKRTSTQSGENYVKYPYTLDEQTRVVSEDSDHVSDNRRLP